MRLDALEELGEEAPERARDERARTWRMRPQPQGVHLYSYEGSPHSRPLNRSSPDVLFDKCDKLGELLEDVLPQRQVSTGQDGEEDGEDLIRAGRRRIGC